MSEYKVGIEKIQVDLENKNKFSVTVNVESPDDPIVTIFVADKMFGEAIKNNSFSWSGSQEIGAISVLSTVEDTVIEVE